MDGDAGPVFARGNTAEIRALDDGRVCKLYDDPDAVESARFEARATRTAHRAGLPVPSVDGVVTIDGRPGVVLERVDGGTLLADLRARPWTLPTGARTLADLHAGIHGRRAPDLPPLRERLERRIERAPDVSAAVSERALAALESLPDDDRLLHGDFHPGNVLLGDRGPVVIDWLDASAGPPAADVARTVLLLRFADGGPHVRLLGRGLGRFYLWAYRRERPLETSLVRRWELPVAVARLTEDVTEVGLRRFVERGVARGRWDA
jgi:Ser/Thr protein kinase RdoA (MazF antagonist)